MNCYHNIINKHLHLPAMLRIMSTFALHARLQHCMSSLHVISTLDVFVYKKLSILYKVSRKGWIDHIIQM